MQKRVWVGLSVAVTLLLLDLLWLGIIAQGFYEAMLGPLRRPVLWPAALLFYTIYVAAILGHAVFSARGSRQALQRGASLGFVAYATYELTNWAVIKGWPSLLVPVDLVWGVLLTATTAFVGKSVQIRLEGSPG